MQKLIDYAGRLNSVDKDTLPKNLIITLNQTIQGGNSNGSI